MSVTLACVLFFIASSAFAEKCDPAAPIKGWQEFSRCAYREKHGVLIGYGYNLNLPHAKADLALLGIDRNDIPKGIINEGFFECDCTQSVCLTSEQSQRLLDINVDRARKQVSNLRRSASLPCCDIENALTALFFTFGMEKLMSVPHFLHYLSSGKWSKLGTALLSQGWCELSDRCNPLAKKIMNGCISAEGNLGCAPPTPKACDSSGRYCCATNNTCCKFETRSNIFSSRSRNQAYWCCPLSGAVCCSSSVSCCPRAYPVCCGATNSCCFLKYPVCCFPGTSAAYCCASSSPVCLGGQQCGSLDPDVKPVKGKANNNRYPGRNTVN